MLVAKLGRESGSIIATIGTSGYFLKISMTLSTYYVL
jgi:hypothetical protein